MLCKIMNWQSIFSYEIGTSHHILVNAQSETIYMFDVVSRLNDGTSKTSNILIFPNSQVLKQSTQKACTPLER